MPEFISILRWIRDIVYPQLLETNENVKIVADNIEEVKALNTSIEDGVLPFEKIVATTETIDSLLTLHASDRDTVIVKDLSRGGTFIYDVTKSAVNDDGTVFNGWVRQYSGAANVKWFGAVGDGVTDDTVAVQNAIDYSSTFITTIKVVSGSYSVSGLIAKRDMSLVGDGSKTTKIKLIDSSNTNIVRSEGNDLDNIKIEGILFDGNRTNNTSGDGLQLLGSNHTLIDVMVVNIAENGIISDWQGPTYTIGGFESFYSNVVVDNCGKNGWIYSGSSDSHFESIYIIDTSLSLDSTYYGLYLSAPSGNGRFFNVHTWNRSTVSSVALHGVHVESAGNNFSGCHFEGSYIPLSITGNGNTFSSCSYYAPRGAFCVDLAGSSNILEGSVGLIAYAGNQNYSGVYLAGGTNQVNIVDTGCLNGTIYFNDNLSGYNNVVVNGNRSGIGYSGIPSDTDTVDIKLGGAANTKFLQLSKTDWGSYTPVLTSESGAFISATSVGKYKRIGSLVNVSIVITIMNKGTAAGAVLATLPISAKTSNSFSLSGRERGVTGKMLQGDIETTNARIFVYDNTTLIENGAIAIVSFFYESA